MLVLGALCGEKEKKEERLRGERRTYVFFSDSD